MLKFDKFQFKLRGTFIHVYIVTQLLDGGNLNVFDKVLDVDFGWELDLILS